MQLVVHDLQFHIYNTFDRHMKHYVKALHLQHNTLLFFLIAVYTISQNKNHKVQFVYAFFETFILLQITCFTNC